MRKVVNAMSNNLPHRTTAPRFACARHGFFGRWIRCQCALPAAVGEQNRWLNPQHVDK
jgi:hypothetical protein